MDKILTVASKEFKDGFRNRWTLAITVIFAILSLGLTYFGAAASGSIGFASLNSTLISLASLAVILIPLIALMIAYNAFVGEYEQGTMLLLLTYPLSRRDMLIGKFLGQGSIIAISSLLGFSTAAAAIIFSSEVETLEVLNAFFWFILSATLLGWVFIAIAYVISLSVEEKSRAAGLALVTWFFFVLVFDLALLAILVASKGDIQSGLLSRILLLNPTDIFRLVNYQVVDATEYGGVLQLAEGTNMSMAGLLSTLLVWIAAPLALAAYLLKKREV